MTRLEAKETPRVYRYYDWVMALFVTVLIVSNIASSAKIVDWGVSLFGFRCATSLYAVGNTSGSVMGAAYPGGGSTLGAGFTFGYLAALHAVASEPVA